jgi:putative ribosome biogenesis GTPase RsgA
MKSVVLVMGASGVGKSSFVARTSGLPVEIGHGLFSCKYKARIRHATNIVRYDRLPGL